MENKKTVCLESESRQTKGATNTMSIAEQEMLVKQMEIHAEHFIDLFDDKGLILRALKEFAPYEFWGHFYAYTEYLIDDMGYGYGIKCPVCGSSLDGGLCGCMGQHKTEKENVWRAMK